MALNSPSCEGRIEKGKGQDTDGKSSGPNQIFRKAGRRRRVEVRRKAVDVDAGEWKIC